MIDTLRHTATTLIALWEATPAAQLAKLANTGLNVLTIRELLGGLAHTDLNVTLIAVLWLIPWDRLAVHALRNALSHTQPSPLSRLTRTLARKAGAHAPHLPLTTWLTTHTPQTPTHAQPTPAAWHPATACPPTHTHHPLTLPVTRSPKCSPPASGSRVRRLWWLVWDRAAVGVS